MRRARRPTLIDPDNWVLTPAGQAVHEQVAASLLPLYEQQTAAGILPHQVTAIAVAAALEIQALCVIRRVAANQSPAPEGNPPDAT